MSVALLFAAGSAANAQVVARMDCRSFGQTASSGGTLNIKYATPVMCWASASTVNGVAVNETGWVPEAFFEWDWNDGSLGSVTRGGISMDLGKSVGVVAAHAFKPSSFTNACGGGTNSLHTVSLKVSAVVNGQRASDSETLSVCVENPQTTWPTPVAFCDDSNCADDPGVPPGTRHGGNGTDLAQILGYCEANGSERVLVEGGVTFATTATRIVINQTSCLIESYGGTKATLDFNGGGLRITKNQCGGYRMHDVAFSGNDSPGDALFGGGEGDGCVALIDFTSATAVGSRLGSVIQSGGGGTHPDLREWYFVKGSYTAHAGPANSFYLQGDYLAWIGMHIAATGEHNIRTPNFRYAVIDANLLENNQPAKHVLALRQMCGSLTGPCTAEASAYMATVSRNEFRPSADGAGPIQLMHDGGSQQEATQTYDIEIIRNLFGKESDTNATPRIYVVENGSPNSVMERVRVLQNAADLSHMDSSGASLYSNSQGRDLYIAANVVSCVKNCVQPRAVVRGPLGGNTVVRNNACFANGSGVCDPFPGIAASSDNVSASSDPFDAASGLPGDAASFDFNDLRITASSALSGKGALDAISTDLLGATRPSVPDPGVFEAGSGGTPPASPPAAPVLL